MSNLKNGLHNKEIWVEGGSEVQDNKLALHLGQLEQKLITYPWMDTRSLLRHVVLKLVSYSSLTHRYTRMQVHTHTHEHSLLRRMSGNGGLCKAFPILQWEEIMPIATYIIMRSVHRSFWEKASCGFLTNTELSELNWGSASEPQSLPPPATNKGPVQL